MINQTFVAEREGTQTELQHPWCHLFPLYHQGPLCPHRLLARRRLLFWRISWGELLWHPRLSGQAYQHDSCTSSSRDWMPPPAGSLHAWLKPTKHISTSHGALMTAVRQPSMGFYVHGDYIWEINWHYTSQVWTLMISSVTGDCRKRSLHNHP